MGHQFPLEARRAVVLQESRNPSTDYFIAPMLFALNVPWKAVTHDATPEDELSEGDWVIIVRYLPEAWRRGLGRHRSALAGMAYFMDDDLLDYPPAKEMPFRYRMKLARLATVHRRWLCRMDVQLWVGSEYLAKKYARWYPRLIEPCAIDYERKASLRIFYHGTASHDGEKLWLKAVMAEVLERNLEAYFEIFGDGKINRLYRQLPRVAILHPMSWDTYLCHCRATTGGIGLALLLAKPFNRARTTTKFFDITRCGAVGIYSNVEPFSSFVRHEQDGLLIDNDPTAWRNAILRLAADAALRQRLAAAAQARLVNPK